MGGRGGTDPGDGEAEGGGMDGMRVVGRQTLPQHRSQLRLRVWHEQELLRGCHLQPGPPLSAIGAGLATGTWSAEVKLKSQCYNFAQPRIG